MDKTIILALMQRIQHEVPQIRWVDLDTGQLNIPERPPIALPACLVDMEYTACKQLNHRDQQVSVAIRLSIIDDIPASTHARAPERIRTQGLAIMDLMQSLHQALQWWDNERMWMPIRRLSVRPQRRSDGLKVYDAVYTLEYIDQQDTPTTKTSSATAGAVPRPSDAPASAD